MKKKIIAIASSLVVIILVTFVTSKYLPIIFNYPHIPKERIIEAYKNNKDQFVVLSNYAEEITKDITVDRDSDSKFLISSVEGARIIDIKVDNKKYKDGILNLLYNLKFKHIIETGNGVYFIRQTDIAFEQGVVFSKDGLKPDWPLINVLESIDGNWYYYESE